MRHKVIEILNKGSASADKMNEYVKHILTDEDIPFVEMSYNEDCPWLEEITESLYREAERFTIENNGTSAVMLQRKMEIGYPKAANLLDMLEEKGIVKSKSGGVSKRELTELGEKMRDAMKRKQKN